MIHLQPYRYFTWHCLTLWQHKEIQEMTQPACIQSQGRQKMGRTVFHTQEHKVF